MKAIMSALYGCSIPGSVGLLGASVQCHEGHVLQQKKVVLRSQNPFWMRQ